MSDAPKKIHLAMAAIMTDLQAIEKGRENKVQNYKFRGIDEAYNALHPIFAAHGVVCIPTEIKSEQREAGLTKEGNIKTRTVLCIKYLFVADDGSNAEAVMVGEGLDSGDKSTAKALSAAHKYLLLQTFLIPTEDIIDGDAVSPTSYPKEKLQELNPPPENPLPPRNQPPEITADNWRDTVIHLGKTPKEHPKGLKGRPVGELSVKELKFVKKMIVPDMLTKREQGQLKLLDDRLLTAFQFAIAELEALETNEKQTKTEA